jgi:dCTP deaminase
MSLLSYNELVSLVESGVIDAPIENINSSSIEVTFGHEIMIEDNFIPCCVDLSKKKIPNMKTIQMQDEGFIIEPGQWFLATTQETFNLPNDIVAEFVLKSSQARSGLNHLLAGYCDPGWNNSKLTLEFHNVNRWHSLLIKPGIKAGQVKFYRVKEVPENKSYAVVGQYNNQTSVTASKGIR